MKRFALGLAAVLAAAVTADATEPGKTMETAMGEVLVGPEGMTLYTFDNDTQGASMSACKDQCLVNWPPLMAEEGAMAEGAWTIVDYTAADGSTKQMWAYDGWPVYYWKDDTQPGDTTGDGVGGVWHVIKVE